MLSKHIKAVKKSKIASLLSTEEEYEGGYAKLDQGPEMQCCLCFKLDTAFMIIGAFQAAQVILGIMSAFSTGITAIVPFILPIILTVFWVQAYRAKQSGDVEAHKLAVTKFANVFKCIFIAMVVINTIVVLIIIFLAAFGGSLVAAVSQ